MTLNNELLEQTRTSIREVTEYDLEKLPRRAELGSTRAFDKAVAPARKVVGIFEKIPLQNLDELPDNELKVLKQQADAFFSLLEKIELTDSDTITAASRDNLVAQLESQHQPIFSKLYPLIAYVVIRTTDFGELETNARASVQAARTDAKVAIKEVEKLKTEADEIMSSIRATAAEQGVSQQAIYFNTEADSHQKDAKHWRTVTTWAAAILFLLAIGSFGIHKIPFLAPTSASEAVQLALSKFLLFAISGYLLVLSARNFLSHKHNAIVNRHKQNSLVTFKALAKAANQDESQNIILEQAAASIFAIPESGFTKAMGVTPTIGNSVVKLSPPTSSG